MVALFESAGSGCSAYRGDVAFPFCPDMAGELSSLGGIRCARPGRMDDQDRREIVGGGNAQRCFILRDDPPLIPAPTCDLHRSFGACPDRAEISPFGLQLPIGGGRFLFSGISRFGYSRHRRRARFLTHGTPSEGRPSPSGLRSRHMSISPPLGSSS